MEQALMQEELSFEHKMSNIHNANSLLDHLERKMNSYFNQAAVPQRNSALGQTDNAGSLHSNIQADQGDELMRLKGGSGLSGSLKPQFGKNLGKGYSGQQTEQLEFKLYNEFSSNIPKAPTVQIQSYNQKNTSLQGTSQAQQPRRQKERLSQTTVYKASSHDNRPIQTRNSNPYSRPKRNEQFRLIGKSKDNQRSKQQQVRIDDLNQKKQNADLHNISHQRNQQVQNSYLHLENRQEQDGGYRFKSQASQNLEQKMPMKSNNSFLHSMETIELVMKESLDGKLRKIKQIQHEIMTENEERVYLYKTNVRLNQELKHLEQQNSSQEIANSQTLEWTIKRLEEDLEKTKKEITKKKAQRNQLKKEEKTMRDGYQTVLNNKKNILRKDIEIYAEKQNKTKQNTEVLRGLMKELDKLKGAVEAKIKNAQSKCTISNSKKRKVIKSFKI